jgi:RimJ/RimL family protein N-acetyltransferase
MSLPDIFFDKQPTGNRKLTTENTIILGDRVRLRPLAENDLPLRVKWYNDPDVRRTLTVTEMFELDKTRQWFKAIQNNDSRVDFFIETPDGRPMGVTGLLHIDRFHKTAECFCVIGEKEYWGGGLGTEIHSVLIAWAFDHLGLEKIRADIRTNNPAIYKVVQKLGFQIEGTLRREMVLEGTRQDLYRIGVLRDEFTPTHTHFQVHKK